MRAGTLHSFQEDEWNGCDYEVGAGLLGAGYWEAMERGERPRRPCIPNPMVDVLRAQFDQKGGEVLKSPAAAMRRTAVTPQAAQASGQ